MTDDLLSRALLIIDQLMNSFHQWVVFISVSWLVCQHSDTEYYG